MLVTCRTYEWKNASMLPAVLHWRVVDLKLDQRWLFLGGGLFFNIWKSLSQVSDPQPHHPLYPNPSITSIWTFTALCWGQQCWVSWYTNGFKCQTSGRLSHYATLSHLHKNAYGCLPDDVGPSGGFLPVISIHTLPFGLFYNLLYVRSWKSLGKKFRLASPPHPPTHPSPTRTRHLTKHNK